MTESFGNYFVYGIGVLSLSVFGALAAIKVAGLLIAEFYDTYHKTHDRIVALKETEIERDFLKAEKRSTQEE